MRASGVSLVGLTLLLAASCSSTSGDDGSGPCPSVEGSWEMTGSCPMTNCNITQQGCELGVRCRDPSYFTDLEGNLAGSEIEIGGSGQSCTGTISASSASGSCAAGCNWTATKLNSRFLWCVNKTDGSCLCDFHDTAEGASICNTNTVDDTSGLGAICCASDDWPADTSLCVCYARSASGETCSGTFPIDRPSCS